MQRPASYLTETRHGSMVINYQQVVYLGLSDLMGSSILTTPDQKLKSLRLRGRTLDSIRLLWFESTTQTYSPHRGTPNGNNFENGF